MKNLITFVFILMMTGVTSLAQSSDDNTSNIRQKQLKNLNDPSTWDMGRMKLDYIPNDSINQDMPLRFGAYPVPDYDSLQQRSFKGIGFQNTIAFPKYPDYRLQLKGKEIMYTSFFMNKSKLYKENPDINRVFFTVITVVDTLDQTTGFAIGGAHISSRNHPDYVGRGYFMTKNNKVEFVGFTTPEKQDYALINMRLFHLNHGNVIVIAPQKDGTLRSLQIKESEISEAKNYDFIRNNILKREEVIEFLTNKDVI